jgi:hypothetical protein
MTKAQAVGFTGTRNGMTYDQIQTFCAVLEKLGQQGYVELHHGDCVGADDNAEHWARTLCGFRTVAHPPVDEKQRAFTKSDEVREPKEYLARNHDIVGESTVLVAAPRQKNVRQPDGTWKPVPYSGTWATIRYAEVEGRKVIIVWPDGTREVKDASVETDRG